MGMALGADALLAGGTEAAGTAMAGTAMADAAAAGMIGAAGAGAAGVMGAGSDAVLGAGSSAMDTGAFTGLTSDALAPATAAGVDASTGAATLGGTSPFSQFSDAIKNVSAFNKASGGIPGNVLGAAANYFTSGMTADKYAKAASDIQQGANPLSQPQRQQYQTQLSSLENNPSTFWQTNPVAMAQLDLAKNMFTTQSGKYGSGGTQFSNYLKNVTNAASGTFDTQAQLLSGLGGFNMPAQPASSATLTGQGIQAQNTGYTGIGNLFGSNLMTPQQNKSTTGGVNINVNPMSGTATQTAS